MNTVAKGKGLPLEVFYGREAPGETPRPLVDWATDDDSLWVWFFGRELVVSRKRAPQPTTS